MYILYIYIYIYIYIWPFTKMCRSIKVTCLLSNIDQLIKLLLNNLLIYICNILLYILHNNMCNYLHNHGHYGLLSLYWSEYEYWLIY